MVKYTQKERIQAICVRHLLRNEKIEDLAIEFKATPERIVEICDKYGGDIVFMEIGKGI